MVQNYLKNLESSLLLRLVLGPAGGVGGGVVGDNGRVDGGSVVLVAEFVRFVDFVNLVVLVSLSDLAMKATADFSVGDLSIV